MIRDDTDEIHLVSRSLERRGRVPDEAIRYSGDSTRSSMPCLRGIPVGPAVNLCS